MSGLPGHDIALALLDACGIPNARDVRAVTFHSSIDELTTIEVEYVMRKQGDPAQLSPLAVRRARFVEVVETEDVA